MNKNEIRTQLICSVNYLVKCKTLKEWLQKLWIKHTSFISIHKGTQDYPFTYLKGHYWHSCQHAKHWINWERGTGMSKSNGTGNGKPIEISFSNFNGTGTSFCLSRSCLFFTDEIKLFVAQAEANLSSPLLERKKNWKPFLWTFEIHSTKMSPLGGDWQSIEAAWTLYAQPAQARISRLQSFSGVAMSINSKDRAKTLINWSNPSSTDDSSVARK